MRGKDCFAQCLHNSVLHKVKKPLWQRGLKGSYLESCRALIVSGEWFFFGWRVRQREAAVPVNA